MILNGIMPLLLTYKTSLVIGDSDVILDRKPCNCGVLAV